MAVADYDSALVGVLEDTERLIIKQEVEAMEAAIQAAANAVNLDALGAFGETANKYDVFTDDGGKKFRVIETSDYCGFTGRVCCRPNHALKLHVYLPEIDTEHGVMHMNRPCKCGQCCAVADICRQEMHVYEGEGHAESDEDPNALIGYIQQPVGGGGLSPQLNVMNREGGEPIATIQAEAVCCIAGMCCDHTFTIKDPNTGRKLGKIVKERPEGLAQVAKELATDADNFTMYVPKDMDPKKKGTMLAALHLIDYMFFEDEGDANCDVVNQKFKFKCCDMYCFGCVCPCHCNCDCGGGGGGDDHD
jgi:hypothetical protein